MIANEYISLEYVEIRGSARPAMSLSPLHPADGVIARSSQAHPDFLSCHAWASKLPLVVSSGLGSGSWPSG